MTPLESSGRLEYRAPLPFDLRHFDVGFVGRSRFGFDGDPSARDAIRIRSRSGYLVEVRASGRTVDLEADNGVTVTMPAGFPRLTDDGLALDAPGERAVLGWPWDPSTMIGDHGFTVCLTFRDVSAISQVGAEVAVFNLGKDGQRSDRAPAFELRKSASGSGVYRAGFSTADGIIQTADDAFPRALIPVGSWVTVLAGVERNAAELRTFLDVWVSEKQVAGAPFRTGWVSRNLPASWTNEVAAAGARPNGDQSGGIVLHRLAWDRGVHLGRDGLRHFDVDTPAAPVTGLAHDRLVWDSDAVRWGSTDLVVWD